MTDERFEQLVRRLEREARQNPGFYKLRVALLASLGYVYIFVMVAGIAAILFFLGSVAVSGKSLHLIWKVGVPLALLGYAAVRSLWVRWPQPEGIPLRPEQAPRLFVEVEEIRRKLKAPKVHRVFLNDEFNAAMERRPRLGVLGWPEGILYLGLPYLQASPPEQLRAVLAHELGHHSGKHGRFTGWIYRIRQTWSQLLEHLEEEQRWGSGVFTRFFSWYAPLLNAYSFVLARAHEYEADAASAEIVGRRVAAAELVLVHLRTELWSEGFWRKEWQKVRELAEPPEDVYQRTAQLFRQSVPAETVSRWLAGSLAVNTGYTDTHPCLRERVAALGFPPEDAAVAAQLPEVFQVSLDGRPSSAEHYLGIHAQELVVTLSRQWREHVAAYWRDQHQQYREQRERQAELARKHAAGETEDGELVELVNLTLGLDGDQAALPLLRQLVERCPNHPSGQQALGRILLDAGDPAGLAHLEQAMRAAPDTTADACSLAIAFHGSRGEESAAERYRQRLDEHAALYARAQEERDTIRPEDDFLPHELEEEHLQPLRAFLLRYERLARAWLVRKKVECLPEKPCYVFAYEVKPRLLPLRRRVDAGELMERISNEVPFPGQTKILWLQSGSWFSVRPKIMQVPGASIYQQR